MSDCTVDPGVISRAQGCLLGQLAGDALGSLVEFRSPESIRREYPNGVRLLADGGTWNTIAGQPTDDSELALLLARSIIRERCYDSSKVRVLYQWWINSDPFDTGSTIRSALRGVPQPESQANGAMMRVSPLGIFGWKHDIEDVARWAREDAAITHINEVCLAANDLFVTAIAHAIRTGCSPMVLYGFIRARVEAGNYPASLAGVVLAAEQANAPDFMRQQGWVLIALQNALWQLLHAPSLEEAVVDTIMRGGDTDTNACICGTLLGAVYGREAVPEQWVSALEQCKPSSDDPRVQRPRPYCFWPHDVLEVAGALARLDS
jgi:ADP-ribosylglycohydrolase